MIRDPDTLEIENGRVVRDSEFYPQVELLLLPTTNGWEAPAWLGFGGFNSCPQAPVHVAFAKWAFENYRAELMTVSNDVLEFVPREPIQSRDRALCLANVFMSYAEACEFGGPKMPEIASALLRGSLWSFWWD